MAAGITHSGESTECEDAQIFCSKEEDFQGI